MGARGKIAPRLDSDPEFRPRISTAEFIGWSTRFPGDPSEPALAALRPRVLARGHLTRPEFLRLCEWKSPRSRPRCRENTAAAIRALTRAAFASPDDGVKMDLLRLLRGVGWPTASVILHFCDERPYPILDVRALWSLGYDKPPHYNTAFWLAYVEYTRALSARLDTDMRTLDKALWQYSKEKQG